MLVNSLGLEALGQADFSWNAELKVAVICDRE